MCIQTELRLMHHYLIYMKFPYHSFSVIHRSQDLGFHIIFMSSVKEKVTSEIENYIKSMGFTFHIVYSDKI